MHCIGVISVQRKLNYVSRGSMVFHLEIFVNGGFGILEPCHVNMWLLPIDVGNMFHKLNV